MEDKDTKIAELQAEFIQADRSAKKLENDLRNMQVVMGIRSLTSVMGGIHQFSRLSCSSSVLLFASVF